MVFWQLRFQSCKIVKVVKPKKLHLSQIVKVAKSQKVS